MMGCGSTWTWPPSDCLPSSRRCAAVSWYPGCSTTPTTCSPTDRHHPPPPPMSPSPSATPRPRPARYGSSAAAGGPGSAGASRPNRGGVPVPWARWPPLARRRSKGSAPRYPGSPSICNARSRSVLPAAAPTLPPNSSRQPPAAPATRSARRAGATGPKPARDGCSRPYRPLRRPKPQINAHRGVERPRSVITPEWHPHDTHRPRRTERRERRSSRSTGQQPVDVARPKGVEPPNLLIRRAIGAPARMAAKTVSGSRSMVTILIPSPGPAMGDQWETGCPETVRKSTTRCGMPSASAPAKTSRGGIKRWPAIFKTLNPRVRGSSPWRRTRTDLAV